MRKLHRRPDEGFSMIEVIVAIVILGIVASSALWFFINGMQTSSNLNRQQTAVTIATSTMEQTFAVSPQTTAGVSGLVVGRSASAVNAAMAELSPSGTNPGAMVGSLKFNGGAGIDGVVTSYPLADPAGGTPVIPIKDATANLKRANVQYTAYTFIGACYRETTTSATEKPCQKATGYLGTTEPATPPTGYARMLRIIVVVTWAPIGTECGTGGICSYDVATLVDPSLDLAWNRVVKPVALDDKYTFTPGQAGGDLNVMGNDVLGSVRSFPVTSYGTPFNTTSGTAVFNSVGTITYGPPTASKATWIPGIYPFGYQVWDRTGASATAQVIITLLPNGVPDAYTVTMGAPQILPVTANDWGSPTSVEVVDKPTLGSVTVVGTSFKYTPLATGDDTFTYTSYDKNGLQPAASTLVSVKVSSVSASGFTLAAPYVSDASAPASWLPLTGNLLPAGLPAGTQIIVHGPPQASPISTGTGALMVDGTLYKGTFPVTASTVAFQAPAGEVGEWSFDFSLTVGGAEGNTTKAILQVPLKAVNDGPALSVAHDSILLTNAGANDNPSTWRTASGVTVKQVSIDSKCGTWITPTAADLIAGQLRITAPSSKKAGCHATYTLTRNGVTTAAATITYDVT